MAKRIAGAKKNDEENIFLYFPVFSLLFVIALAVFGIRGNYSIDEGSAELIFWSFFFVFLLLPLGLQVAWLKKHYGIAQVLPIFIAFGGYALYYILGDWMKFLFFISATILGVWINILAKKEEEG
ncbi:MAG: hypothetical protein QXL47_03280 [Candidatus Anstonellales archaeon]